MNVAVVLTEAPYLSIHSRGNVKSVSASTSPMYVTFGVILPSVP